MKKWMKITGWTVLAVVTYFIIEMIFYALLGTVVRNAQRQNNNFYVIAANLALKAVTLLFYGGWYLGRERRKHCPTDRRRFFTIKNIICICVIGLLGQYAVGFVMALVRVMFPAIFENYDRIVEAVSLQQGHPLVILFLVGVLGPIAEEVLFRGVIYGKLREGLTILQAAIISGAIFGIYHKNMVQAIYATIFGIILAYVFEKTGTLWGAIMTHMLFNLSSYLITWLKTSIIVMPVYTIFVFEIISILAVVTALCLLRKQRGRWE